MLLLLQTAARIKVCEVSQGTWFERSPGQYVLHGKSRKCLLFPVSSPESYAMSDS